MSRYSKITPPSGFIDICFDGRPIISLPPDFGKPNDRLADWLLDVLTNGLGSLHLELAAPAMLKALEMFETCFAEPIENDDEMEGADTVEAVCTLWHRFIKPALAEARGEVRTYARPAEQEG